MYFLPLRSILSDAAAELAECMEPALRCIAYAPVDNVSGLVLPVELGLGSLASGEAIDCTTEITRVITALIGASK